jgi:hypothetical protein
MECRLTGETEVLLGDWQIGVSKVDYSLHCYCSLPCSTTLPRVRVRVTLRLAVYRQTVRLGEQAP